MKRLLTRVLALFPKCRAICFSLASSHALSPAYQTPAQRLQKYLRRRGSPLP
jgi:hypothetical protein